MTKIFLQVFQGDAKSYCSNIISNAAYCQQRFAKTKCEQLRICEETDKKINAAIYKTLIVKISLYSGFIKKWNLLMKGSSSKYFQAFHLPKYFPNLNCRLFFIFTCGYNIDRLTFTRALSKTRFKNAKLLEKLQHRYFII